MKNGQITLQESYKLRKKQTYLSVVDIDVM
jgi:hypothetical protein